jgi:hypothetical protein
VWCCLRLVDRKLDCHVVAIARGMSASSTSELCGIEVHTKRWLLTLSGLRCSVGCVYLFEFEFVFVRWGMWCFNLCFNLIWCAPLALPRNRGRRRSRSSSSDSSSSGRKDKKKRKDRDCSRSWPQSHRLRLCCTIGREVVWQVGQ